MLFPLTIETRALTAPWVVRNRCMCPCQVSEDDEVLPRLTELQLRDTRVSEKGIAALSEIMMPTMGGLPMLRTLLVDDVHHDQQKLQAVYRARTGQNGIHRFATGFEIPLSARTPRVQQSPRFAR